eukprot:2315367-Pyramimonas_sp.AAC.1
MAVLTAPGALSSRIFVQRFGGCIQSQWKQGYNSSWFVLNAHYPKCESVQWRTRSCVPIARSEDCERTYE